MALKDIERKRKTKGYTISTVADHYGVHQQTLRLYEREGLLKPSRSKGKARLYTDEDIERLEVILNLTRDLGVNLAGVDIILNMREKMDQVQREFNDMREKMDQMQREFNHFFEMLRDYMSQNVPFPQAYQALVPTRRTAAVRSTARRGAKNQNTEESEG
jgi:MerR family transcriptional regulator/heat shock protein HspR